ncbi:MAG: SDR family oxidoreductase [Acidobacteriota bacterium]
MNTQKTSARFEGRVAAISGGGSGIGFEAARRLLEEGASVVLNGRNESKLEAASASLDPTGDRVAIVPGDIGVAATARQIVAKAKERFGGLDLLVNNAGIFAPKPFLELTEEDYDAFLTTILRGKFFLAQEAAKAMIERGGGAIVQTGSLWALQAIGATPSAAYSAANAGVHQLTRNLAIELAEHGIRINTVAPAVVETPVYETFLSSEEVAATLPQFAPMHPLGRNGQPADVVEALLFLASDDASFITGTVLPVDGGVMAGRN